MRLPSAGDELGGRGSGGLGLQDRLRSVAARASAGVLVRCLCEIELSLFHLPRQSSCVVERLEPDLQWIP